MPRKDRGISYALISSIFGSTGTVFATHAAKLIHPIAVSGIGQLIAGAIITLYLKATSQFPSKRLAAYKKDLALLTLLRPIIGQMTLLIGLSLTLSIKAVFFMKIEPYFIMFWGWLLHKEKVHSKHIILLLVHLFGAFLLSTSANIGAFTGANLGDLLIIIAMVIFSYTYFVSKKVSVGLGAKTANGLTGLIAGIIITPLAYLLFFQNIIAAPSAGWLYLTIYTIFFYIISLTLWYAALKTVKGWIVSAVRIVGSVIGAIFAYLLFAETLGSIQIIGAAIVLITSAMITREHNITSPPSGRAKR